MIFKTGLMLELDEDERAETDNGYLSLDPKYCKCGKGYRYMTEENSEGQKLSRARQETANSRFKAFKCLQRFRHVETKHEEVFRSVACIVQVGIRTGDSPLFKITSDQYNDGHNI